MDSKRLWDEIKNNVMLFVYLFDYEYVYACMCKTVFYSTYETDGWGLLWAFDLKLIIRKAALHLSSVYLLPCYSSACQFLSLTLWLSSSYLFLYSHLTRPVPDPRKPPSADPVIYSAVSWMGRSVCSDSHCLWTAALTDLPCFFFKLDLLLKKGAHESILCDTSERKHWIYFAICFAAHHTFIDPSIFDSLTTELSHSIPHFLQMHYTAAISQVVQW